MTTILIVVHIIACVVLIVAVLLQAGRGADMGAAFGGASTPMFGSGSSTNPLTRMTTVTAVLFLLSALFLAVGSAKRASVFDSTPEPLAATPQAESSAGVPIGVETSPPAPPAAAPVAEAQPLTIPATPNAAADDKDAADGQGVPATDAASGNNATPKASDATEPADGEAATDAAKAAADTAAKAEAAAAAVENAAKDAQGAVEDAAEAAPAAVEDAAKDAAAATAPGDVEPEATKPPTAEEAPAAP